MLFGLVVAAMAWRAGFALVALFSLACCLGLPDLR